MAVFNRFIRKFSVNSLCKRFYSISRTPHCKRSMLGAGFFHCLAQVEDKKTPIEYPDFRLLSHEQLIQQACTATVNSASQLLTSTLVALVDIALRYRKALEDQMSLMEECLQHNDNEGLQQELTDLITAARYKVDLFRRNFVELTSLMEYVEKLVESTTETSFLAGAETACSALSERLHSAKIQIDQQKEVIKQLEAELIQLQTSVITRASKENLVDRKS